MSKKSNITVALDPAVIEKMDRFCKETGITHDQYLELALNEMLPTVKAMAEYTVHLSSDPSAYGPGITDARASNIADELARMVRHEFPGIKIVIEKTIGPRPVIGPDSEFRETINYWIQKHWMNAL